MVQAHQLDITTVETKPYEGQKPGTSGLRKKVKVFQQPHYLENFIQSLFASLPEEERVSLVIGGDGRFYNDTAIQVIVKMALAAGYQQLYIGQHGFLSTPAVSNLIRYLKTNGGIVLSASHNPAGPDEDFGIKYNNDSGAPAPESITQKIYENSQTVSSYQLAQVDDIDLSQCQTLQMGDCTVEVLSSVDHYVDCMKACFDFPTLKSAFEAGRLSLRFDAMHAITGPYAKAIFVDELGASADSVVNAQPLSDFGKGHPDPNLTYAKELVDHMFADGAPMVGAASDGDGDRNMILGRNVFVTPSDSLAIIAEHADKIVQFKSGLKGVARSMPTSTALDRVAKALDISVYETPTGWKFFGNLLDDNRISLCGEESFGTSGDHIREKDGIWAVLCWLTIVEKLDCSVEQIAIDHWNRFGRSVYCRHDFEGIEAQKADQLMAALQTWAKGDSAGNDSDIESSCVFCYEDPVDGSVTDNQGVCVQLTDGSRIVYRLSGTGTDNATLRMYLELYTQDSGDYGADLSAADKTAGLAEKGMELCQLTHFTGLNKATLIT